MSIEWGKYDRWHKRALVMPCDGQKVRMGWLLAPDRECVGWYENGDWLSEQKDWILGAPDFWLDVEEVKQ